MNADVGVARGGAAGAVDASLAPLGTSEPRPFVVAGLVGVGAALWFAAGNEMPWRRWAVVIGAVTASLIPWVNVRLARGMERLRHPSPRAAERASVLIGFAATLYLTATAFLQRRDFSPNMQDEASYVIGTRMLAHARLWMPAHPLADFFESFFIWVKPVYCSTYFPGTAMLFMPMEWADLPKWVLPVAVAGLIVGVAYRLFSELMDGVAGALAAVWLVSLADFRTLSFMVMSHLAFMLRAVLILWVWLRWRREPKWNSALLLGVVCGWASITRPADAVVYAVPVGVAMMVTLARRAEPLPRWAQTATMLVCGAAPLPGAARGVQRWHHGPRAAHALQCVPRA